MSYVSVENLSFSYDNEPVLENISFTVESGEFVILTGENGAAKSTLLKNILWIINFQSTEKQQSQPLIHREKHYPLDMPHNKFLLLMWDFLQPFMN